MTADEHGEQEGQAKKDDGEPDGEFLQHVGGLRAPDLAGGGVAEGGAEAFLTWALHEHDENEKKADDDFDCGEDSNKDVHKRARIWGDFTAWQGGVRPVPNPGSTAPDLEMRLNAARSAPSVTLHV